MEKIYNNVVVLFSLFFMNDIESSLDLFVLTSIAYVLMAFLTVNRSNHQFHESKIVQRVWTNWIAADVTGKFSDSLVIFLQTNFEKLIENTWNLLQDIIRLNLMKLMIDSKSGQRMKKYAWANKHRIVEKMEMK